MLEDIECKVLHFFTRSMLDVYQLVSSEKDALVAKNATKLALRNISEVTISDCRRKDLSCVLVLGDGTARQEYAARRHKSQRYVDGVYDDFVRRLGNAVIGGVTVKCASCLAFFRYWAENHATTRAPSLTGWLRLYVSSCCRKRQSDHRAKRSSDGSADHDERVPGGTPLEFALDSLSWAHVRLSRPNKLAVRGFLALVVAFLQQPAVGSTLENLYAEGYFAPTGDFCACLFESAKLEYACFSTRDQVLWVHTIVERFLHADTVRAMPERILIFYPLEDADPLHLPLSAEFPHKVETRTGSPPHLQSEFVEETATVYAVHNESRKKFLDIFVGTAKNRGGHGIYFFNLRDA